MKLIKKELYRVKYVDTHGRPEYVKVASPSIQIAMDAVTQKYGKDILSIEELGWVHVVVPV